MATQHTVSDGAAVELVRFDAPSTRLVLHPGYQDPGGSGWSTHSAVRADERPSLLAAFNGGFKLDAGAGGMAVGTRQAGQLVDGLATVGVQLPRTAVGQEAVSRPTSAPRPGDLVFFGVPGAAYHVAIYLGGGRCSTLRTPGQRSGSSRCGTARATARCGAGVTEKTEASRCGTARATARCGAGVTEKTEARYAIA